MLTKEDVQFIVALLRGDIPQGSKEGIRAQGALAKLLLDWGGQTTGVTREICWELGSLFLPAKPRRVTIKKYVPNRVERRDSTIAGYIDDYLKAHGRGTWEAAIRDAKKHFAKKGLNLSEPTIKRAWGKYKRGEIPPF
jgi:hypothetical protein